MKSKRTFMAVIIVFIILAAASGGLYAEEICVPNASFELPKTNFVDTNIDSWQIAPKPWWYDENTEGLWNQKTGVFLNLPPTDPRHIDNCDANQAAWLWSYPEVELFQELDAVYEAGWCYHLIVGVIGGGAGSMLDGASVDIRLYYLNETGEKVAIDSTTVTYDASFGYVRHFEDARIDIPVIGNADPWLGKNIGIQLLSALDLSEMDKAGGFWDIDNVRLTKSMPGADLTGDCFVDFNDLAILAQQWLSCTSILDTGSSILAEHRADLTGDGCVTIKDLKVLMESWLERN